MKKAILIKIISAFFAASAVTVGGIVAVKHLSADLLKFADKGATNYRIVYAADASDYEKEAAEKLKEAFAESTGIEISVSAEDTDGEKASPVFSVGQTALYGSGKIYDGLKYYDYSVQKRGGNILLCSNTEEGFDEIIDYLNDTYFSKYENNKLKVKFEGKTGTVKALEKQVALEINGKDISEYTIVCNDEACKEETEKFVKRIAQKTGALLKIKDDGAEETDCEILIGETNREASSLVSKQDFLTYRAETRGQKIIVKAGGAYSMHLVFDALCQKLLSDGSDKNSITDGVLAEGDLRDRNFSSVKNSVNNIRTLNINLAILSDSAKTEYPDGWRQEIVASSIKTYSPDLIAFQQTDARFVKFLKSSGAADNFSFVDGTVTGVSSVNCIAYDKTVFSVEDSGAVEYKNASDPVKENYVWARLEKQSTGEKVAFASTGWVDGDEDLKALEAQEFATFSLANHAEGYSVVFAGQYEATEFGSFFRTFLINSNLKDGLTESAQVVNRAGTEHTIGIDDIDYRYRDHVALSDNIEVFKTDTLTGNEILKASEHTFLLMELGINEIERRPMTIAGVDIGKFSIVYSDEVNESCVKSFVNAIYNKTDVILPTYRDRDKTPSSHEILLGNTNRDESAELGEAGYLHIAGRVIDGKLAINFGGEHSMLSAAKVFISSVAKGTGPIEVKENYKLSRSYFNDPFNAAYAEGTDIRIMDANVLAEYLSYGEGAAKPVSERKEIFFALLDYYKPTIAGLQLMTPEWMSSFNDYKDAEKWDFVRGINSTRLDYTYIWTTLIYRNDLYNCLDSGFSLYDKADNTNWQYIVWAKLQTKKTGRIFYAVTTKLSGDEKICKSEADELAAFVRDIEEKGFPVVLTGDFSANFSENKSEGLYGLFLEDSYLRCAKPNAKLLLNNISSIHDFGKKTEWASSRDHIFLSPSIECLRYETSEYNESLNYSDHSPLFADIAFSNPVRMTIAGNNISGYSVVYGANVTEESAKNFARALFRLTGRLLRVYSDSGKAATGKEILLGETNRAENANFTPSPALSIAIGESARNLVIKTGGEYSLDYVAENFKTITSEGDDINIPVGYRFYYDMFDESAENADKGAGSDIRVMNSSLLAEWDCKVPVSKRKEIFFGGLRYYNPAVVGLQQASPEWIGALNDYIKENRNWSIVTAPINATEGYLNTPPVFFRNDVCRLIGSGSRKYNTVRDANSAYFTWAELEVIETGKRFTAISSVWEENGPFAGEASELKEFISNLENEGKSVILMGNFSANGTENTSTFTGLCNDAYMLEAKQNAENLVTNISDYHYYGEYAPSSWKNSRTHIVVSDNLKVKKFNTSVKNRMIYLSRNAALIADIELGSALSKNMTVAGNDIRQYTIVYGSDTEAALAKKLRSLIREKTGAVLPFARDTEKTAASFEILLGTTNRPESANVTASDYLKANAAVENGKLAIKAGGEHSLEKMLNAEVFLENVTEYTVPAGFSVNEDYWTEGADYTGRENGTSLRVMTQAVMTEWGEGLDKPISRRKEILFATIEKYDPDIVALQEFSPSWVEAFKTYKDKALWTALEQKNNASAHTDWNNFTTILFRNDRFDLLDSGFKVYDQRTQDCQHLYAWALLREKNTGREEYVIATQFASGDAHVSKTESEISELTGLIQTLGASGNQIILLGDFGGNASLASNTLRDFRDSVGFLDVKAASTVKKYLQNKDNSYHDYGEEPRWGNNSRSGILASSGITSKKIVVSQGNEQKYMSVSYPMIADVALRAQISVSIAGNSLRQYKIVYGPEASGMAQKIKNKFTEEYGITLPMVPASQGTPSEYEILVGNTGRTESINAVKDYEYLAYIVKVDGNKLVMKFGGEYSLADFLREFNTVLTGGASSTSVSIPGTLNTKKNFINDSVVNSKGTNRPAATQYRVMSEQLEHEWLEGGKSVAERSEIMRSSFEYYDPDIAGVQNLSPKWFEENEDFFTESAWSIVKADNPANPARNGEYLYSAVAYRKAMFECLESGSQVIASAPRGFDQCFVWARLKDKRNAKEMYVVSLMLNTADETFTRSAVQELTNFVKAKRTTGLDVIVTGFYGSKASENSDAYKDLMKVVDGVDARMYLRNNDNAHWYGPYGRDEGSYHVLGDSATGYTNGRDHITLVGSLLPIRCQITGYNELVTMSKSFATITDLTADRSQIGIFVDMNNWIESDKARAYYTELEGKKYLFIGDSYFAGNGVEKSFVWPGILGTKYSATIYNHGINGSTMSEYSGGKEPMCVRYNNINVDSPDVIVLEGGTNDFNRRVPLGDNTTRSTTTFKGALRTTIEGLYRKYPGALVICVTCWRTDRTNADNRTQLEYAQAMVDLCNAMGVPVIDARDDNTGVRMTDAAFRSSYCMNGDDTSHLNKEGMKIAFPFFEEKIAAAIRERASGKTMTVAGEDIGKYAVVYGSDITEEQAQNIVDKIYAYTRKRLLVYKDTERTAGTYEILVGNTNRSESTGMAYSDLSVMMRVSGKKLCIKTGGAYTFNNLMANFNTYLGGSADPDSIALAANFNFSRSLVDAEDTHVDSTLSAGADYRFMSLQTLTDQNGALPYEERAELLLSAIRYYNPAIVGLQNFSDRWQTTVDNFSALPGYTFVNPVNPERTASKTWSTILFKNDIFEPVDSGTRNFTGNTKPYYQNYTYVLLRDKATGEEICAISACMANADQNDTLTKQYTDELVSFVNEKKTAGYHVVVLTHMGKYGGESNASYTNIKTNAGMTDMRKSGCTVYDNNQGSTHTINNANGYANGRDHILLSSTLEPVMLDISRYREAKSLSDSYPVIGDVKISSPIRINGNVLKRYSIVYDSASQDLATGVKNKINDLYGVSLPMYLDTARAESECEILVGNTNRSASALVTTDSTFLEYRVKVEGNKLVMKFGGNYSLKKFLDRMNDYFTENTSGNTGILGSTFDKRVSLTDDPTDNSAGTDRPAGSKIRLMSAQVAGGGTAKAYTAGNGELLLAAIEYYAPDVVTLQYYDQGWYSCTRDFLENNNWSFITNAVPNSTDFYKNLIIYRNDLYSCEGSGMIETGEAGNLCWGLLKDRNSGKQTYVISVFLNSNNANTDDASMDRLTEFVTDKEANGFEVIVAGHFGKNVGESKAKFNTFLQTTGSVNARNYTRDTLQAGWYGPFGDNYGSFHDNGRVGPHYANGRDSVVVTSGYEPIRCQITGYNEIYAMSYSYLLVTDLKDRSLSTFSLMTSLRANAGMPDLTELEDALPEGDAENTDATDEPEDALLPEENEQEETAENDAEEDSKTEENE